MNTKVQTVLAATDLSRDAFAAARRAALTARAHTADLELAYVIPESFRAAVWHELRGMFTGLDQNLHTEVTENLHALVHQLEQESGLKARAVVLDGNPPAEIAEHARRIGADLIVIGAHGENAGLALLGSTAQRVLRCTPTPVLLVKRTPPLELAPSPGYARIIVATDLSEQSARAAASTCRLFPQASVTLFHAFEAPAELTLFAEKEEILRQYRERAMAHAERALESFATAADLPLAQRMVREGPAGPSVRAYAAHINADLIALGASEGHANTAFLGSVAIDVVTQAQCDVLLVGTMVSDAHTAADAAQRPLS